VTEPPGAKLVVGPGVKLKGAEIQDCDMLLVEGRVEATMDSRLIQIADQGSFDGTVNIDVAEIRGRFSGELTAREQLIIHSTGRVSGKIRYGKIVVHEGGELSGDVKSLTSAESANTPATPKPNDAGTANMGDLTATAMSRIMAAKTA
jgi:cytoskeletal protein CcmA (bactofilin family)